VGVCTPALINAYYATWIVLSMKSLSVWKSRYLIAVLKCQVHGTYDRLQRRYIKLQITNCVNYVASCVTSTYIVP